MNEQVNDSNAAFMEAALKKIEAQDKKIADMAQQIGSIPDNRQDIQQLKTGMNELKAEIKNVRFPVREMQEFSKQLTIGVKLLREPATVKTLHHIPKLAWVTAGLFLAFCFASTGWYITGQKLDGYIANDTKYRMLRLDTAHHSLQLSLDRADSLYQVDPDLRKSILETEEQRRVNFERLQKAERLKNEAKRLEEAAGRKSN
ncbi:DUF2730 family protein [Chitinophaga pollutisoli]|uniref:DUF2730 family protein n=1 Tax=Chitinophaga pollutisoli TaxID=3133966 RepID=A0ABZ2YVU6_9BACT